MDYTIRVLVKCSDYGFKILMDPHQDTVHIFFFPHISFLYDALIICPLVVPFLRWRRRSVLDFGSMRHKPTQLHSNPSRNPPLRISNSGISKPRSSTSHVMEHKLRSSPLSNLIHPLLRRSFIRSKMHHRQPQHPRLVTISLH